MSGFKLEHITKKSSHSLSCTLMSYSKFRTNLVLGTYRSAKALIGRRQALVTVGSQDLEIKNDYTSIGCHIH
jgi:hypothetical protein